MDGREEILNALTNYAKDTASSPSPEISPILERYLTNVAKNGETLFPWQRLKPLIVGKMEQVIQELRKGLSCEHIPTRPNVENVRFDVMHDRIMDALHKFSGAPFTIQRLCELLTDPKRHYKRSDKFMRGLEKNVLVVSTVDPFGRKEVRESGKGMVNGLDSNGVFPLHDSNVQLPPVPDWVTSTTSRPHLAAHATVFPQTEQTSASEVNGSSTNGSLCLPGDQINLQTEEVVEEMVVTMETHELSSVSTGSGEAMAETEEELSSQDKPSSSTTTSHIDDPPPSASIPDENLYRVPSSSGPEITSTDVEMTENQSSSTLGNRLSESIHSSDEEGPVSTSPNQEATTASTSLSSASNVSESQDTTPRETDEVMKQPEISRPVRTYAEVVASSSISPLISDDPPQICDSVAGLERLVGSVQPSSDTDEVSSVQILPLPKHPREEDDEEIEPQPKRSRISSESSMETSDPAPDTFSLLDAEVVDVEQTAGEEKLLNDDTLGISDTTCPESESNELKEEKTEETSERLRASTESLGFENEEETKDSEQNIQEAAPKSPENELVETVDETENEQSKIDEENKLDVSPINS